MGTNELAGTFDTAAPVYAKIRPGYPGELYETIFRYMPLDRSGRAVEVGIGGGQATLPFLQTGCALTAVEYGRQFARLCREKFAEYRNFTVIAQKFEDCQFPDDAFDLVYSASAFHWVPEEVGYPKVFSMLKRGGAFARFANHPYLGRDDRSLTEEIDRLYAAYYYRFYGTQPQIPAEYSEEALQKAKTAERYGFVDIRCALFRRTRILSAREYRMLLGTYSDHIAMEPGIREEFFSKVEQAINRHGGSVPLYDTIDLQLARKP